MKKRRKNSSGMTLVELIVTFALIGLFMTAASFVLSSSLQLFTRMKDTANAIKVSDFLLDKIAGEIAAAKSPKEDESGKYYFWLSQDGYGESGGGSPWVVFENRTGSPIAIYAVGNPAGEVGDGSTLGTGSLYLKYYKVQYKDSTVPARAGAGDDGFTNEINWHFDERAYMGYTIQSLLFYQPQPDTHPNVIKIKLELFNPRTKFSYERVRYAKNYSFDSTDVEDMRARTVAEANGAADRMPPVKEEEFKKGTGAIEPPPEPERVSYWVYYVDQEWKNIPGWDPEERKAAVGDVVSINPPPKIQGYEYDPWRSFENESGKKILGDSRNDKLDLFYKKMEEKQYPYLLLGSVESFYMEPHPVKSSEDGYSGTEKRLNKELFNEVKSAPLEDDGKSINSPKIKGYDALKDSYTIELASDSTPQIEIPYRPKEIEVRILAQCEGQPLVPQSEYLTGTYGATINLDQVKQIEEYTCSMKLPITISLENLDEKAISSGIVIYIEYKKVQNHSAPFPPAGPNEDVSPSEGVFGESVRQVADRFSEFFLNDWNIMDGENGGIGYRTFTGSDGKTYAIAGYCELSSNANINKIKDKIASAAGVDKNNIIYLNKDKGLQSKDMKILWNALVNQMNIKDETKEQMLAYTNQKIGFEKIGEKYCLTKVSFTTTEGTRVEITYSK